VTPEGLVVSLKYLAALGTAWFMQTQNDLEGLQAAGILPSRDVSGVVGSDADFAKHLNECTVCQAAYAAAPQDIKDLVHERIGGVPTFATAQKGELGN